jgi:hypothetical protein
MGRRTILVVTLWAIYTVAMVAAQNPTGGIQPLTQETAQAAANEGATQASPSPLNDPKEIRLRARLAINVTGQPVPCPHLPCPVSYPTQREALAASDAIGRQIESMPFGFQILTPYTIVVALARDAARTFTTPTFPSIPALNAGLVQIVVSPGSGMMDDIIQNVVIKRGGQVIKPLKAVVVPVVLTNAFGAKWESARGTFTFEFATFAPDQAITIVLIGRGDHAWTMPPEELSQLK